MPKIGALAVSISRVKSSATRDLSFMVSRILVRSWPHATMPAIPPRASRKVAPLIVNTSCPPSFVFRFTSNSPRSSSLPLLAFLITSRTTCLQSSPINSSTRGRPSTSSLVYPDIWATLSFHSMHKPFLSMPMIGALAQRMSRAMSSASRFCSAVTRRISVMSWPTPITPVTSPSAPRKAVAFINTSRWSPPLVISGNSKSDDSSPPKAFKST
mmetsp:Transcript_75066/g.207041  ORF Transcript_75066/g.207041 Transcript_75066/m.207041 type:complete len:213 (+) Transcript_75066:674-1312(+)